MLKKIRNFKFNSCPLNGGMSYSELIVVLAIMGIMSVVVISYDGTFNKKIEIKSLANDVALKIVQAQKLAMGGKMPPGGKTPSVDPWKPSYGVYFNKSASLRDRFVFFVDLNNNRICDNSCVSTDPEYLETYSITGGNYIDDLMIDGVATPANSAVSFVFARPDSSAIFVLNGSQTSAQYASVKVSSSSLISNTIKVYSSGRVQIN